MKLKIEKTYKGEKYWFELEITHKSNECTLRQYSTPEKFKGVITDDFKYVEIDKPIELSSYYMKLEDRTTKEFTRFKIPKDLVFHVRECVEGI